jgi:hypothetical protein
MSNVGLDFWGTKVRNVVLDNKLVRQELVKEEETKRIKRTA